MGDFNAKLGVRTVTKSVMRPHGMEQESQHMLVNFLGRERTWILDKLGLQEVVPEKVDLAEP